MTIQVAARLPDETVAFIDAQVAAGAAPNRAAWLARAAERQRSYEIGERAARIYAESGEDPDLVDLVTWRSGRPVDLGD
jgi:hypothetical protein